MILEPEGEAAETEAVTEAVTADDADARRGVSRRWDGGVSMGSAAIQGRVYTRARCKCCSVVRLIESCRSCRVRDVSVVLRSYGYTGRWLSCASV